MKPAPLPDDVRRALAGGKKIEAIRMLRERTGLGLAEAKAAVEKVGRHDEHLSPGEVPRRSGSVGLVAVVLFVIGLAVWYLAGRW